MIMRRMKWGNFMAEFIRVIIFLSFYFAVYMLVIYTEYIELEECEWFEDERFAYLQNVIVNQPFIIYLLILVNMI